jgi:hypothetical protein
MENEGIKERWANKKLAEELVKVSYGVWKRRE